MSFALHGVGISGGIAIGPGGDIYFADLLTKNVVNLEDPAWTNLKDAAPRAMTYSTSSRFDADVLASRPKAVAAWRTATKNDPLATKALDSQIAYMKELRLL